MHKKKLFTYSLKTYLFIGLVLSAIANLGLAQALPDLAGVWNGSPQARPVNSETVPWGEDNFPKLNKRAKAYQEVWEEIMAPKYDCQPASSPAIQYDPYHMEVTQWPDRVLFRYEKDDQLRTVYLDGRTPTSKDFSLQGFSVGYYEDESLFITTTNFVFDIAGFDDYNGIPSSSQKVIKEKYWREGEDLYVTVTVSDPMFLIEPTSYTTRWVPAAPGYKLSAYDCDAESSRAMVRFFPSKY
jgi:hypothetical protein